MDSHGGYLLWCFYEKLLLAFESDILARVSVKMTLDIDQMALTKLNESLLKIRRLK